MIQVTIPQEYIELASDWHHGQSTMLYALASTGNLTLGTRRPYNDDGGAFTDEEWHLSLWLRLASEVRLTLKGAERLDHPDSVVLCCFAAFCEATIDELRQAYGC